MEAKEIPLSQIQTGIHDVRDNYDDDDMPGLIVSIKNLGVLNPITVKQVGDMFQVVAGHRRTYAARKAQLKSIPCIIRDGDLADTKEVVFAENMYRRDLSPVELANGMLELIERDKMTLEQVAHCVNKSVSWVRMQLSCMEWPDDVKLAVHEKKLKFSAAHNLAQVKDDSYRNYLLRSAIENGATARTTAAWLQGWQAMLPVEQAAELVPEQAEPSSPPLVPSAPCFVCDDVFPNQSMMMVLMCVSCGNKIRNAKK